MHGYSLKCTLASLPWCSASGCVSAFWSRSRAWSWTSTGCSRRSWGWGWSWREWGACRCYQSSWSTAWSERTSTPRPLDSVFIGITRGQCWFGWSDALANTPNNVLKPERKKGLNCHTDSSVTADSPITRNNTHDTQSFNRLFLTNIHALSLSLSLTHTHTH